MELKKNLFEGAGLDAQETIENLEGLAVDISENESYIKPFEVEKIEEMEAELVALNKKIVKEEEKLKTISDPLKASLKEKRTVAKDLSKQLNDGGEEVKARTFSIPDHENGMMGVYTEQGILLSSRPFTPREKQLHINSVRHLKAVGE